VVKKCGKKKSATTRHVEELRTEGEGGMLSDTILKGEDGTVERKKGGGRQLYVIEKKKEDYARKALTREEKEDLIYEGRGRDGWERGVLLCSLRNGSPGK